MEKINLIYIASIGRSGTTLLESILGSHSKIATSGELHIWPHELRKDNRACYCEKPISQCDFWKEMEEKVNLNEQKIPRLDFFREKHNAGRTLRIKRIKEIFQQKLDSKTIKLINQYGHNNYDIFDSFSTLIKKFLDKDINWVVDASKDPYRLFWLIKSGLFNIKVIHVVRNPRGFTFSVMKPWLHKNIWFKRIVSSYYCLKQSAAWTIQNWVIRKIIKKHLNNIDYSVLKYEDLSNNTEGAIRQILKKFDIKYEEKITKLFWETKHHTIAGNPMRYRKGIIKIDEKWKRNLPIYMKVIIFFVTFFERKKYSY